ncbi:transketolase [Ktedonobacter sp. SOSP1-52]|uniref:thiamine pyrophosphate-dependent enzyme n=1 Tax=Ktedonobacter sp. SOSP1-52 TaxID=2778366 RepID=UPI0019163B90|nr:thiamine pyrophosphate-dependent enzyme [Ktedonobacter sp. SOSP1-52]GHO69612.1 transketolase [Ktedonobacter sp. SOSP1-52]
MDTTTSTTLDEVKQLMRMAVGDEKHDVSAHSTLNILWVLYDRVLRYVPDNPEAKERDRFLLSKGHGPLALYAILAAKGFFSTTELERFGTWEGILGGHPDRQQVPGVEISTGSLGHGLPMAVGVALALRAKKGEQRVFVLIGDGECNEGSIWEAVMLAGQLNLANLTCILVNNHSSLYNFSDLETKFSAFHWQTTNVDGRNHEQLYQALSMTATTQPHVIIADIAR